jgi:uncharacterized circularly permuted ATP-grasp superfamily protein
LIDAFNEMVDPQGAVRDGYRTVSDWLTTTSAEHLRQKQQEAEFLYRRIGITFAVYGAEGGSERIIPFDIVPRVFSRSEWQVLERGLTQRVKALNAFLNDVYGPQEILKAGVVPEDLVLLNSSYCPQMQGFKVPGGVYTHIAGIDLVRDGPENFYVLEDNARTPSGVSYMLENREMMMRLFPELFATNKVSPVDHYPEELLATLISVAPPNCADRPTVAILTPGSFNSAYFEHSYLADRMGADLVEGQDLFVLDNKVYTRTTRGPRQIDIIYKRVDDDFLDPLAFRPDSMLGVPGLFSAYRAGNVTLANAIGAGVADDKAVYIYVPDMIRFYLGEEPILNNVPTWKCANPDECAHVLAHLDELVVKEVHGSGGYGMLVGPTSSRKQREAYGRRIKADPKAFIAQPTLALSTCPTFVKKGIAPRHIDFRPYVLCGREIRIVPGGLTRVALKEGSLVVNSSQGGGTKDTWVIDD